MGQLVQDPIIVMFDLDGTLADTGALHYLTQSKIAREFLQCGINQQLWAAQCVGKDHAGILDVFRRQASGDTDMTPDEFIRLCEQAFEENQDLIQPIEGMRELVERLGLMPHVYMGVNSSSSRGIVDTALSAMDMNIEHRVSATGLAALGKPPKPAADSYVMSKDQICDAHGVRKPRAVYIFEDSTSGLLSARAAADIFAQQGVPSSVVQIASARMASASLNKHRAADILVQPGVGIADLAPLITQGRSLMEPAGRSSPRSGFDDAVHLKI